MSLSKSCFSHKLGWFSLAVAFLVLGPAGVFPAQAQPKAELTETTHDFGQVREDMPLVHIFAVRNTGDQNLQILDVDPDCACTVAKYDRVIPPGGSGAIILEIQPFSVIHAFKKKTVIRFNAPALPMATLVLTGQAQRGIEIAPSHIVRFRGNPRDKLTAQVRLTSNMSFPWQITKMENTLPDKVEATLKTEQPGKVYVVELKNKSVVTGHYVGMIELFTNVAHRPKIYLRVIADLSSTDGAVAP
jgi:hypothetical protein